MGSVLLRWCGAFCCEVGTWKHEMALRVRGGSHSPDSTVAEWLMVSRVGGAKWFCGPVYPKMRYVGP